MKSNFKEFYALTEREFDQLWSESLIVLDANVLLSWYRYSENTVKEFNKILEKMSDRLWLPHQITKEFHTQRPTVIFQQIKVYTDFIAKLNSIEKELSITDKNPFLSLPIFNKLIKILNESETDLNQKKKSFERLLSDDITLRTISNHFENKIGKSFSFDRMTQIKVEGLTRYKSKIPPGYMDNDKNDEDKFGDFIVWLQLLEKAKDENRSIIFVTDDRKEDWWLIKENRSLGPRPELRREFAEMCGQEFYIYKPFRFLEYAYKYLQIKVNNGAIQELKTIKPLDIDKQEPENFKLLITIEYELINMDSSSVTKFIKLIQDNGYDIHFKSQGDSTGKFYIIIPNITDLARRIKTKFVSQLENYGLRLIDYKSEILADENHQNLS